MKKTFAITMLLMIAFMSTNAQDKIVKKEIIGTWNYTADEAPYEYQKGKIHFYEEGAELKSKLEIQGYFINSKSTKIEGSKIVCKAYVEYELVTITLTMKDGKLDGNAETSEGILPVKLEKAKDKD